MFSEKGDSGGPWFSENQLTGEVNMAGVHAHVKKGKGEPGEARFYTAISPYTFFLPSELELLTTATEVRRPELGRCVKQTGGWFAKSNCEALPKGGAAGKYEWEPGPGPKSKFTVAGGASVLETKGKTKMSCTTVTGTGAYNHVSNKEESPKEVEMMTLHFQGCSSGGNACTTGANAGEVTWRTMLGEVNWEESAKDKVALLLEPEASPFFGRVATITCGALELRVNTKLETEASPGRGVLVPITSGKMVAADTLKFVAAHGVQKPKKWEGSPETNYLRTEVGNGPYEESGLEVELTLTNEEDMQVGFAGPSETRGAEARGGPITTGGPPMSKDVPLAVCAVFRDEGPYLAEWVEFHRLVGVGHFFLYDDRSRDAGREVLAPYVREGLVTLTKCAMPLASGGQAWAYADALRRASGRVRWLAFIDIDEFLFSPEQESLVNVFAEFEQHPGVVVNWQVYGSSGLQSRPEGLVIESFTRRAETDWVRNRRVKSVVDPARAVRSMGPHFFEYSAGELAVTENQEPVTLVRNSMPERRLNRVLAGVPAMNVDPYAIRESSVGRVSVSRLRINHYAVRSRQEFAEKLARHAAGDSSADGTPRLQRGYFAYHDRNEVNDPILMSYAPRVRERMARRRSP